MIKQCLKCRLEFEPTAAQTAKNHWICKACRKVQNAESRARRKSEGKSISGTEMPRAYHAAYEEKYNENPEVRARKAKQAKSYRNGENRYKHEARWKVARALIAGSLVRLPCEVCVEAKVDAHHDDYSKPLSVTWLCRKHHSEIHAKAKGATK